MAWTTPRTWAANETVTAALMNTHVRDNLSFLGGAAPIASIYATASTTMTAGATLYAVAMDSETVDTDGMHSTSTNTSRLTANTAGYYVVTGYAAMSYQAAASYFGVGISYKGGTPDEITTIYIPTTPNTTYSVSTTRIIYLAVNDYVELRVRGGTAGATTSTAAGFQARIEARWIST